MLLVGFARALRRGRRRHRRPRRRRSSAAVDALGVGDAAGVYWAGRRTLCAEPDDLAVYDAVFARVVRRRPAAPAGARPRRQPPPRSRRPALGAGRRRHERRRPDRGARRRQRPRCCGTATWPSCAAAERASCAGCSRCSGRDRPRRQRRRRRRPARRGGSAAHGADQLRPAASRTRCARRRRGTRPRRVVLLLDVSGSMAPYADGLLRFAHARDAGRPVGTIEVFTLGTRLTRITRRCGSATRTRARARRATPSRTGPAAPGWATRCRPSSTAGGGAAWPAARSSSCSPTDGSAATPRARRADRSGCAGWRTGWSGSTRTAARRVRARARRHRGGAAAPGRLRGRAQRRPRWKSCLEVIGRCVTCWPTWRWWRAGETGRGRHRRGDLALGAPAGRARSMLVGPDGEAVGSVSGGCVEGAVYELASRWSPTGARCCSGTG